MSLFRPKEYLRVATVSEATNLLKKHGESAAVLAGGTDLLVAKPPHVEYIVDISRLPLSYVEHDDKGVRIGALTTLSEIGASPRLKEEPYDAIAKSTLEMGTPLTKNYSTIGGNLCTAAPSADMPPSLIALDAEARITGPTGKRKVPVGEFFTGPKKSVLKKGELLTEIFVPKAPAKTKVAFLKKGRTSEDIAQVNAAVRLTVSDGTCKAARIVLGAVAPTPIRAKEAEAMLEGKKLKDISTMVEKVAEKAADASKPISDIRSSAEYRKAIAKVLVKRALAGVVEKFGGS
ncbi:MAG: xanthine dehydrogenase family protein subunit M [Methanobacteriota archaeon]